MRTVLRWVLRLALLVAGLFLAWNLWIFGHVVLWNARNPGQTAFMAEQLERLREKNPQARLQQTWVPYGRISGHLKRAVVAAEDGNFLDHEGFDWEAIERAVEKNRRRGRVVAGGSTISQQLAKNLFLSPQRSAWRKGEEVLITVMLEAVMDKQRILEIYLNVIEWGDGVFGAQAAARHYFGVDAGALSPAQAARLAAMIPNPRYYDHHRGSQHLARKTGILLARMPVAEIP
jgi:monofunctional glycosyltransferase